MHLPFVRYLLVKSRMSFLLVYCLDGGIVLVSFHAQMSFMGAIYKRIKYSKIEDLLVDTWIIIEESIDKALEEGTNPSYEALLRLLMLRRKENDVTLPETLTSFLNSLCYGSNRGRTLLCISKLTNEWRICH